MLYCCENLKIMHSCGGTGHHGNDKHACYNLKIIKHAKKFIISITIYHSQLFMFLRRLFMNHV